MVSLLDTISKFESSFLKVLTKRRKENKVLSSQNKTNKQKTPQDKKTEMDCGGAQGGCRISGGKGCGGSHRITSVTGSEGTDHANLAFISSAGLLARGDRGTKTSLGVPGWDVAGFFFFHFKTLGHGRRCCLSQAKRGLFSLR